MVLETLANAARDWLAARADDLLPVPYFHVVFTLPAEIAAIAFQNKTVVYGILFKSAAETLRIIAADPRHLGAGIGLVAVLHSWGQTLSYHPHLQCIVPGGGPSPDGTRWIACRPNFFLPVRVLSRLYRRLFLQALRAAFDAGQLRFFGENADLADPQAFARLLIAANRRDWVVYAKPPFGGPEQVLADLSRYTHRVAIANSRLVNVESGKVTFRWRDYRHGRRPRHMTLDAGEFIRRFLLHTLPDGVHRIRHYGFLANGQRAARLAACRALLADRASQAAVRTAPATKPTPVPRPCLLLRAPDGNDHRLVSWSATAQLGILERQFMSARDKLPSCALRPASTRTGRLVCGPEHPMRWPRPIHAAIDRQIGPPPCSVGADASTIRTPAGTLGPRIGPRAYHAKPTPKPKSP
jgi:hypothetical protein